MQSFRQGRRVTSSPPWLVKLITYLLGLILTISYPNPVTPQETGPPLLSLSDAVTITLSKNPNILLQEQLVKKQQGVLTQSQGDFNPQLTTGISKQLINSPLQQSTILAFNNLATLQLTDQLQYNVALNKKFRTGVTMGTTFQIAKIDTNLNNLGVFTDTPGNFSTVAFQLSLLLLKNRGREATGAQEMAAEVELEASGLSMMHTASLNVMQTVQAYWRFALAINRLAVMQGAEGRARELLENVRQLVAGKMRPAGDLEQIQGNLDQRIAQRINSEQECLEARKALGLVMGLQGGEILATP